MKRINFLLTLLLVIGTTVFTSCKNDKVKSEPFYKYYSKYSDSIVLFSSNYKISILKDNL